MHQHTNHHEFYATLAFIRELRCLTVFRERVDDDASCGIRACCIGRDFHACQERTELEVCLRLEGHESLHRDACVRNPKATQEVKLESWTESGERPWFGSEADRQ